MIVLGIETSTDVCSVGLAQEGKPLREERVVEERIHSEKLLSLVQHLLSSEQIVMSQISAIAVSIGPGSFTGLRIGLSTAKGLCYALNLPLVIVPTFDVIVEAAAAVHSDATNILVALDAKKGDFYSGVFKKRAGSFAAAGMISLRTEAEVRNEILTGSLLLLITDREDLFEEVSRGRGGSADVHPFCRGDIVAQIGSSKARAKQFADPESCEPMYLKDFLVIGKNSVG